MSPPPRVFVSHASEDKERFVNRFAARLRESGVDAWLDKWEMLPGDSLVDKIFEEGLKDAQAVIVVLSRVSVVKPWVREEHNCDEISPSRRSTASFSTSFGLMFLLVLYRPSPAEPSHTIHERGPFRAAAGESRASPSMLPPQCFARALRA